jgi:hypothetical protein
MAQTLIGVAVGEKSTSAEFELGTRHYDPNTDKEYIYVQAGEALTANAAVVITEAGQVEMADTTSTASAFGDRVGVVSIAFDDEDYGWAQIYGACTVSALTGCAANAQVIATGTAGRVDDATTSGSEVISGLVLTAVAADNLGAALLTYPTVGATL